MSAPTVDIAFAMTGDVHRNTRALRQLGALAGAGLRVRLLALPPGSLRAELPTGVQVTYLDVEPGRGPRWFRTVHRAAGRALAAVNARLYHASDLYVLRAVAGRADRSGAPFTYDARELYTHVAATARRPLVRVFWRHFEAAPIRKAAAVFTVSDSIADHLAQMYGIRRPHVQLNAPVADPVTPDPFLRTVTGLPSDLPLFLHLGQMRAGRGNELLVRAVAAVSGAALVFLGYGPGRAAVEALAAELGVTDRVRVVDPVPPDRIRAVAAGAQVGVSLLEDTCLNHRFALPNKLFDYLAAGLPVLASRLTETTRIVEGHDVGVVVDPSDGAALRDAIGRMATDESDRARWAANARRAAETFDWHTASERFVAIVRNLLATSDAPDRTGPQ